MSASAAWSRSSWSTRSRSRASRSSENYLRAYPLGDLAAQVLGHLGEVTADQLKERHFKGYSAGDVVGQDGLEWTYDQLAARPRRRAPDRGRRLRPAQAGRRRARRPHEGAGRHAGHDHRRQGAGRRRGSTALGIHLAHSDGKVEANGGAARGARRQERRRPRHGQLPDLRPRRLGRRHQHEGLQAADRQVRQQPDAPPADHGGQGGRLDVQGRRRDRRSRGGHHHALRDVLLRRQLQAAGRHRRDRLELLVHDGHGSLALVHAITQSCDVYFYNVGYRFYAANGTPLADWARRLGMEKYTGIDVPGEVKGRVPTRRGAASTSRPRSTSSGSRATRSTWPSARATSRRRHCSWRSSTPPSPTAARS